MLLDIILVAIGLIALLLGGDFLVRGAVSLAAHLGVPTLLIGLTIVAFGTSAPELVVSIQAVLAGDNGIAVGNIVGSNIANILLVLGLPALMAPIALSYPGLKRHTFFMILATALFAYVVYGRQMLDVSMGLILLAVILAYIVYTALSAMRPNSKEKELIEGEISDEITHLSMPKTLVYLIGGLILLPVGATLLVNSGSSLASTLGVRDELIGLTIVAFGTSLPELATVWAAARKGEADVACGNVLGSNIFNILFVGGAMGVTSQFGELTTFVPDQSLALRLYDMPVMIGAALILAAFIFSGQRISRLAGALFVIAYVAYIVLIGANASPELPA